MAGERPKRGLFRRYVSLVGTSAKGAVGAESIKQLGQFAGAAFGTVKTQVCPRCMEKSLVSSDSGHYQCTRADICGFTAGSEKELEAMREASFAVNPRILAISKGFTGDFRSRSNGAKRLSWMFWIITALVMAYSFSWAVEMKWLYFFWTFLVAVYTAINAIRYAYMSYRLIDAVHLRPRQFLARPGLWFVG
jgi:hypothetical protein